MLRGNNALYRVAGDSAGECLGIRLKICCGSSMDGADEQLGKDGEPGGSMTWRKLSHSLPTMGQPWYNIRGRKEIRGVPPFRRAHL